MSPFTVDWLEDANDALALAWLKYPADRAAMNKAALRIDALLASDPVKHGVHRLEGLYHIDVHPFRAYYSIDHTQSRVDVETLAWIG